MIVPAFTGFLNTYINIALWSYSVNRKNKLNRIEKKNRKEKEKNNKKITNIVFTRCVDLASFCKIVIGLSGVQNATIEVLCP
jgi:hypothetical protein